MEMLIGLISGMVTAMGMGGGTILILMLTLFLNIPQKVAQAVNLIFFVPTSITSIILNIKNKNINFKIGIYLTIFGIIGAIIGAELSNKIESQSLRMYFGIFLLCIAVHEVSNFFKLYIKEKNTHTKIKDQKEVN